MRKSFFVLAAFLLASSTTFSQFRENNQHGLNVFETPKPEKEFKGIKTTIGGGFTQGFQALSHTNNAPVRMVGTPAVDNNALFRIRPGFVLASANLELKTALADGIALNMELYLASRHHNETWVKGGFLQIDKLPFLKLDFVDNIMKYTTIKVGQMDVNYGDSHYRRSDGGNTIMNPFVENYIVDAFATEVGVEANVNVNGFIGVLGVTNGLLNANVNVIDSTFDTSVTPRRLISAGKNNPSFIAKLGYDKNLTEDLRVRLTGSLYHNEGAVSNTLFAGDRAGSNYIGVIEFQAPSTSTFRNGRFGPGFSDKVTALASNLFVKFKGLESFTTLETASGRTRFETSGDRSMTQFATDLIYRFGPSENFWVGARYNTVTSELFLASDLADVTARPAGSATTAATVTYKGQTKGMYEVSIDRLAFSAGWFITKNVMAKVEYVDQKYTGFLHNDIRSGAKFDGIMAHAVIGF